MNRLAQAERELGFYADRLPPRDDLTTLAERALAYQALLEKAPDREFDALNGVHQDALQAFHREFARVTGLPPFLIDRLGELL